MVLQISIISFLSFVVDSGIGNIFIRESNYEEENPPKGNPVKLSIVIVLLTVTYFFGYYADQN